MLTIGEIIKAQGVKGEIKVRPLTNDVSRFKKLRAAYINSALFQIVSLRIYDGFVFLRLGGVEDRNKAESFVGQFVQIDRVHAVATEEDEYFIADLIGLEFFVDEKPIGNIKNVHQNGAADVFEVALKDEKTMLFPFLKRLNLKVDFFAGRVSACSKTLDDVAVID